MGSPPSPAPSVRWRQIVLQAQTLYFKLSVRAVQRRRHLCPFGPRLRPLPWGLWCRLCAPDAAAVFAELGARSPRALSFLQIGSNDGVSNDPLHETIRAHQWTGVLVEPVSHLYRQLVANYAGVPGLAFEQLAIGDPDGSTTLFVVEPRPGDPEWVSQIGSFDRDVVLLHRYAMPDIEARIRPTEVATSSLPALVAHHRLDTLDVLHVDAEGFDLFILDQIDLHASWAPRFIVFEAKHAEPDRYRHVLARFRAAGYRRVSLWPDELFYRPLRHDRR